MALALLRYEAREGDRLRFHFDLGRNRYYAYAIGDEETAQRQGIDVLSNRIRGSGLVGPVPDEDEGRGEVEIPANLFDREHRHLQLVSFRDEERRGPAFSPILQLDPGDLSDDAGLPDINFSRTVAAMSATHASPSRVLPRALSHRGRPSNARIRRRPGHAQLSQAQMFGLDAIGSALLSALPRLLPMLVPTLADAGSKLLQDPTTQQPIQQLINAGLRLAGVPGIAPLPPPPALPALPGAGPTVPAGVAAPAAAPGAAPLARAASLRRALSQARVPRRELRLRYGRPKSKPRSEAMIAPALLAAIPALMPLLQNVLSPQTIQGVLQTADPNRLIGTITQGIGQLAQIGGQLEQQHMQHLERLNPGVDDPAFMGLLAQMSTNFKEAQVKFRPAKGVRLHFVDVNPVQHEGRSLPVYRRTRDWSFPLSLESARTVPPGELRLVVKRADSLEVLARNVIKTPPLSEGRLGIVNTLTAEELARVKPGDDYLVCASLTWKRKSGERYGVEMTQLVTAADEFLFDAVEDDGEVIALNDVDRHRDFWHEVWTAELTREVNRHELECQYYFLLENDQPENGWLATTTKTSEGGVHRRRTKLESGLLLSPRRLNELLPQISPHPSLDEAELLALRPLAQQTQSAARTSVKFKGRPGRTAALWVYPELKIKQVLLQRTATVDDKGMVQGLEPHVVHFPIPVLAHFVGVQSR